MVGWYLFYSKHGTIVNFSMYIKATLVLVMIFFSVSVAANCLPSTEYERIYCEIVDQGEGKSLPRFEDFKRNDVTVQKLLLKRPAAKLKIKLPASSKQHAKKVSDKRLTSEKPARLKSAKKPVKKVPERALVNVPDVSLSKCSVVNNIISCGHRRFNLKKNEPNSRLAQGVLDDQYKMGLPRYSGNAEDDQEIQFYLSDAYGLYIQRMIDIGLGASTMSYARFYHTFNDLQAKNVDFSERFETMYRFLKKDKKTMAVKSEPSSKRPHSISQCDDISHRVIVCDIGVVNWVYVN